MFYADGKDKAGNRLLTSYGKRDQAERYRAGAAITDDQEQFLVISDAGTALIKKDGELLLRSLMIKAQTDEEEVLEGNFVLYARIDGRWQPTKYRYPSYAAANQAMKTLIAIYDGIAVIEE